MKINSMFSGYTKWQKFLILLFVVALFLENTLSIYDKSVTWDEKCYIGAGKYITKTGNFDYNAFVAHPPLSYYINSLFLYPLNFDEKIFQKDDCWEIGNDMIFHSGYNPFLIAFLARLPFILISIVFSLIVLKFAEDLYGIKSAVFAMFLYTFSVSIMSFSNLALTDFLVTFFIFITIYCFWKLVNSFSTKCLLLTGLFFGMAQLSKVSALILIPTLIFLAFMENSAKRKSGKKRRIKFRHLLAIFVIGFVVVWAGYGFSFKPLKNSMPNHYAERAYEEFDKNIKSPFFKDSAVKIFEEMPIPFPSYFFGLGGVAFHSREGIGSFLNGKITEKTTWYFPLEVFLLKTQLSLIILLTAAILFFNKAKAKDNGDLFIIAPIILSFALYIFNNMTSGLRHILPIYPFLFVLISRINAIKFQKFFFKILAAAMVLHYLASSILAYPDYVPYFNEAVGGPSNGYRYLVGSNNDLGQNLPQLKEFMAKNGIQKINLSYFGSVDPKEYGISYDYMPSPYFQHWVSDYQPFVEVEKRNEDCSERKGWVAISVTNLQNVHLINKTCFDWLKEYRPAEKLGYSIFVYKI